jgi:hypothetical protein
MRTCIYGLGSLNGSAAYPEFLPGNMFERVPVDFFFNENIGRCLQKILVMKEPGRVISELTSWDLMVGECASIALLPEVSAVSFCKWHSYLDLGEDGRRLLTLMTCWIASAAVVRQLLEQAGNWGFAMYSWLDQYRAVLEASGGIVLTSHMSHDERGISV